MSIPSHKSKVWHRQRCLGHTIGFFNRKVLQAEIFRRVPNMTNHNTLVDAEGVPCANRGNALHDHTLKDVNSLLIQQKMPQKRNLQTITPSILIFLLKKTLEAQ